MLRERLLEAADHLTGKGCLDGIRIGMEPMRDICRMERHPLQVRQDVCWGDGIRKFYGSRDASLRQGGSVVGRGEVTGTDNAMAGVTVRRQVDPRIRIGINLAEHCRCAVIRQRLDVGSVSIDVHTTKAGN